jgi:hypothetical protein
MFQLGGTGVLLNKYLGVNPQGLFLSTSSSQSSADIVLNFSNTNGVKNGMFVYGNGIPTGAIVTQLTSTSITLNLPTTLAVTSTTQIGFSSDSTQPAYTNQSELNIQDLLWTENRDRKYDHDVYKMRGIYQRADQDFDLSQFGLFLQTGTIFMVFHLRDMVDMIGRKLMAGDVLELQHLKDYDALDGDLPAALKRYYVVGDASFASEGFSPTWWPHLWRVKLNPMVDSQEYKDILNNISAGDPNVTTTPVGDILSTYNKYMSLNENIIAQAEIDVPQSGYNTGTFYTLGTDATGQPQGDPLSADATVFQGNVLTADNTGVTADSGITSPTSKIEGYLTGDGRAPNNIVTGAGISFPANPNVGDYYLRMDYLPNRLFRFDGGFWRKIEDNVRTNLTPGATDNLTQRAGYVNNNNTYINTNSQLITAGSFVVGSKYKIYDVGDTNFVAIGATSNVVGVSFVATGVGTGTGRAYNNIQNERQNLSQVLTPGADN